MPKYKRLRKKDDFPPLVNLNNLAPEKPTLEGVEEEEKPKPETHQLRIKILYGLLGFFSGILFAGSILIIGYSC